jgi:excinuclease UvrABC helicase subunit UvrB
MARAPKAKQEEMFQQQQVPEIEAAIMKADEKRAEIEEFNETQGKALKDLEGKVRDAMHKHLNALDAQQDGEGHKLFVYKRGTYDAKLKEHERLSYGKVREAAAE